ncbi:16858_t:CDS:2 [Funneliformis geosporum]|uniref:16231_t:CDS:1 n=1 Tax=Funneliformis geosporum TaxID=1117311 RepID=A0A9W4SI44_9GLOM|nr:16231_t:CDS:2 [Funneliformis geosporum]CAI2169678.1 16858_t:CDS:2 [Funneliformis geosporum]
MGIKISKSNNSSSRNNSSSSNARSFGFKRHLHSSRSTNRSRMISSNQDNDGSNNRKEEFKYVDGRRYHNVPNLRYHLPNDDIEIDRLHLQHYLTRYIWQSNYSAPVHELLEHGGKEVRVLDVGCGPGTWILEMASDYPKTEDFHGTDISSLFPSAIKPFNSSFSQQNVLEGLNFPDNHFDYVYMRFLMLAFSTEQWKDVVIPELVRVTKKGGYVEIMEWDVNIYKSGPITKRLMNSMIADFRSHNFDDCIIATIPEFMKENQMTDIEKDFRDCPQGRYAGKLGSLNLDNATTIFRMYKPKFSKEYGMNSEEYDQLIEDFIKEMDTYKSHNKTFRLWGKKL